MAIKKTKHEVDIERINPTLREKIVFIPVKLTSLSPEEVQNFFGGDLTALRDITKLAQQPATDADE